MQLRYKSKATLKKALLVKQANGVKVESYSVVAPFENYTIFKQELNDEISASIYGADINSMLRISTIKSKLETFLKQKVNNSSDNISKYYIFIGNIKYRIKSVKKNWIDIREI